MKNRKTCTNISYYKYSKRRKKVISKNIDNNYFKYLIIYSLKSFYIPFHYLFHKLRRYCSSIPNSDILLKMKMLDSYIYVKIIINRKIENTINNKMDIVYLLQNTSINNLIKNLHFIYGKIYKNKEYNLYLADNITKIFGEKNIERSAVLYTFMIKIVNEDMKKDRTIKIMERIFNKDILSFNEKRLFKKDNDNLYKNIEKLIYKIKNDFVNEIILNICYNNKLLNENNYDNSYFLNNISNLEIDIGEIDQNIYSLEKKEISNILKYLSEIYYFSEEINEQLYKEYINNFEDIIENMDFIEIGELDGLYDNEVYYYIENKYLNININKETHINGIYELLKDNMKIILNNKNLEFVNLNKIRWNINY